MMVKKKYILKILIQILVIVLITTVVFTKGIIPVKIDGQSMYPSLHDGDIAVVNALFSDREHIKRFDIVILKCELLDRDIVKRVIGLPGETVSYQDDRLYINGIYYKEEFLDQEYIQEAKLNYQTEHFTNDFEVTLKANEIFVLGDNRLHSSDSRTLGTFSYDDIIGKNGLIVFPFKNTKFIE